MTNREYFEWACGLKGDPPHFKFQGGHGQWHVFICAELKIFIGEVWKKRDPEDPKKPWSAYWGPPLHGMTTSRAYKDWEAENAPTKKSGFRTHKEASAWIVERSLKCGVLYEEHLKLLSPLEQLALAAE